MIKTHSNIHKINTSIANWASPIISGEHSWIMPMMNLFFKIIAFVLIASSLQGQTIYESELLEKPLTFTDSNNYELDTVYLNFSRFDKGINLNGEKFYLVDSVFIIHTCDISYGNAGNYILLPLEQNRKVLRLEGFFTYGKKVHKLVDIFPYCEIMEEMCQLRIINYKEKRNKIRDNLPFVGRRVFHISNEHVYPKDFWGCINECVSCAPLKFAKNKRELNRYLQRK